MDYRAMRRAMKEIKDEERIMRILNEVKVGYLGLYDEEGTYVVPVNFAWLDGKIYFHGSNSGRKVDAIKNMKRVCFTVAKDYGTVAAIQPADVGTSYMSVMVFGKIYPVSTLEERTFALQGLLDKHVPSYFDYKISKKYVDSYRSSTGSETVVYCIEPDQITGKEDVANDEQLFYHGRKQKDDIKKHNRLE